MISIAVTVNSRPSWWWQQGQRLLVDLPIQYQSNRGNSMAIWWCHLSLLRDSWFPSLDTDLFWL